MVRLHILPATRLREGAILTAQLALSNSKRPLHNSGATVPFRGCRNAHALVRRRTHARVRILKNDSAGRHSLIPPRDELVLQNTSQCRTKVKSVDRELPV